MLLIINLILGIGLLVSGRKLFWLFVAAAGFFAGVELAARLWHGPEWLSILTGLALGLLFAGLAMVLKSIAIGVAGFFLGGAALIALAGGLGIERGEFVLYIVGGILGVIFISTFFDWALIAISSLAGASILMKTLDFGRPLAGLVFILLLATGIAIQVTAKRRENRDHD